MWLTQRGTMNPIICWLQFGNVIEKHEQMSNVKSFRLKECSHLTSIFITNMIHGGRKTGNWQSGSWKFEWHKTVQVSNRLGGAVLGLAIVNYHRPPSTDTVIAGPRIRISDLFGVIGTQSTWSQPTRVFSAFKKKILNWEQQQDGNTVSVFMLVQEKWKSFFCEMRPKSTTSWKILKRWT